MTDTQAMSIRQEEIRDIAAIRRVNEEAFGHPNVARIVDALREHARLTLSLVAEVGGEVVGHVGFSSVEIDPPQASVSALQLSPLAVLPEYQRRGIGAELVQEGLSRCRVLGTGCVFLTGRPSYYSRFGFVAAIELGATLAGEDSELIRRAFQVIELSEGALSGKPVVVTFATEFDEVG